MTAQINDTIVFQSENLAIVGVEGGPLVHPIHWGIIPTAVLSACWRGFYVTYEIPTNYLLVTELCVWAENPVYPAINGISPILVNNKAEYIGINTLVPFTGGLLLAKDFISAMYVHMGFQKPYSYQTVIECLLTEGMVTQVIDHSDYMAEVREHMAAAKNEPSVSGGSIADWVTYQFSLDYKGWGI